MIEASKIFSQSPPGYEFSQASLLCWGTPSWGNVSSVLSFLLQYYHGVGRACLLYVSESVVLQIPWGPLEVQYPWVSFPVLGGVSSVLSLPGPPFSQTLSLSLASPTKIPTSVAAYKLHLHSIHAKGLVDASLRFCPLIGCSTLLPSLWLSVRSNGKPWMFRPMLFLPGSLDTNPLEWQI